MEFPQIQLYHGDGKGKTSAAIGAAIRCAGAGGTILFVQFMKRATSSERQILGRLSEIELLPCYSEMKFTFRMNDMEKAAAAAFYQTQWQTISQKIQTQKPDMVILDEVCSCISCGFLPLSAVLELLQACRTTTEFVLTGRMPAPELLAIADYITECRKEKHPFDMGLVARRGIEY